MTEQELRQELSRMIRVQLIRKHWTQKDLAEATGISEHTISKYRNASVRPSLKNVLKISDALGVEIIQINTDI